MNYFYKIWAGFFSLIFWKKGVFTLHIPHSQPIKYLYARCYCATAILILSSYGRAMVYDWGPDVSIANANAAEVSTICILHSYFFISILLIFMVLRTQRTPSRYNYMLIPCVDLRPSRTDNSKQTLHRMNCSLVASNRHKRISNLRSYSIC